MKKIILSKTTAFILAVSFSLFIIACLKEQKSTTSSIGLTDFTKLQIPSLKIIGATSKASSRNHNCESDATQELDLSCQVANVTLVVNVPALKELPACDVTVSFRVTECISIGGQRYVDYDNFEYIACQEIMKRFSDQQAQPQSQSTPSLEEEYAYRVSLIAEWVFTSTIAQPLSSGSVIESNFYQDLCYRTNIIMADGTFIFSPKEFCGTGCCLRSRIFTSHGPNVPLEITTPRYIKIGECEDDEAIGIPGTCERSCGPQ
jgi:hypothetical protein